MVDIEDNLTQQVPAEEPIANATPTEVSSDMKDPSEQSSAENSADVEDEEDDESLPFPRARIVKLMKEEIGGAKQIRSEVKEAVNIWLGALLKKIAHEMGGTQFGSVGIADFQRATKPYDMITDIVKDEDRLRLSVNKLGADSMHIMRELDRFFTTLTGKKTPEPEI